MNPVLRDGSRAAVYAAEAVAFEGTDLELVVGFQACAGVADLVTSSAWWPGPSVELRAARSDARSSTAGAIGSRVRSVIVRLAASQCTVATVAHELAHALAGIEHRHDEIFRRAYLDVVLVATNLTSQSRRHDLHRDQLADAFAAFDLDAGSRTWPAPHGFGEPIAL